MAYGSPGVSPVSPESIRSLVRNLCTKFLGFAFVRASALADVNFPRCPSRESLNVSSSIRPQTYQTSQRTSVHTVARRQTSRYTQPYFEIVCGLLAGSEA